MLRQGEIAPLFSLPDQTGRTLSLGREPGFVRQSPTIHRQVHAAGELCERYGVWQAQEKDGVKKTNLVRSTFIIDKQGVLTRIRHIRRTVRRLNAIIQRAPTSGLPR